MLQPDSTIWAQDVTYNGLLVSSKDTTGVTTTIGYDVLGRRNTVNDPRTGTTTTAYVADTNLVETLTDSASVVQASYEYDSAGRVSKIKKPLNTVQQFEYNARGQLVHQWGNGIQPVEYVYDSFGQRTEMHTYRGGTTWTGATWPTGSTGTADATIWNFNEGTGLLTSKTDAASKSVAYTYTQTGQIATRTWARSVSTTYTYSSSTGELQTVTYSDTTPSLTYTYNRLGKLATVVDATSSSSSDKRSFVYNLSGNLSLQREELPSFFNNSSTPRRMSYDYAASGVVGRPTGMRLGTSSTDEQTVTYGYDASGRVSAVTGQRSGYTSYGFTYAYVDDSHLVETVSQSTVNILSTRTYHDHHDSMVSNENKVGGTTVARFQNTEDYLGRVTSIVRTGTMYDGYNTSTPVSPPPGLKSTYTYNDRSELASEITEIGTTGTGVEGRQATYTYDNAGSRTKLENDRPGSNDGPNLSSNYTINSLNQVTSRDVPRTYDVAVRSTAASVTVDSQPMDKQGDYFFRGHSLSSGSGPVHASLAISGSSTNLEAFLPATSEPFTYDDDGNLAQDGRWAYLYDAENRLVMQVTRGASEDPHGTDTANQAVWTSGVLRQKLVFTYDYLGRRVRKQVYHDNSGWTLDDDLKFAWNGWTMVAMVNGASSNSLEVTWTWGLDLSGSEQGAGGVGGLLMTQEGGETYMPVYDCNGNVRAMADSSGGLVAQYEYDAFGNTLCVSGTYASLNPFRFSTRYTDIETGLIYYGLRYYSPSLGRFINRDPIGEQGGLNLYGFCGNNGVNGWDYLGMDSLSSYIGDSESFLGYAQPYLKSGYFIADKKNGLQYWSSSKEGTTPNGVKDVFTAAEVAAYLGVVVLPEVKVTASREGGSSDDIIVDGLRESFHNGIVGNSSGTLTTGGEFALPSTSGVGVQNNPTVAGGSPNRTAGPTTGERFLQAGGATVGLVANTAGVFTAFGLALLPEPTMLSKAGAVALGLKSSYGAGANFQNLLAAINGTPAPSTGALINDITALALPGNQNAQTWASIADLTTDLSAGPLVRSAIAQRLGLYETFPVERLFIHNPMDLGVTVDVFQGLDASSKLLPHAGPLLLTPPPSPPPANADPRRN